MKKEKDYIERILSQKKAMEVLEEIRLAIQKGEISIQIDHSPKECWIEVFPQKNNDKWISVLLLEGEILMIVLYCKYLADVSYYELTEMLH